MFLPAAETGIRAIIAAGRRFDVNQFAEGAKSAYRMVLEAFWKGDREELGYLCDADVHASFVQAIDAREAEGQKLENRLIRIEKMQIADASVNGRSEEHTSELQSLMRISYAVFCLNKKKKKNIKTAV